MNFSSNQVRHLYVAKALKTSDQSISAAGDIKVKTLGTVDKSVYFEVQGADTVLKSDYIPVKGITSVKAIPASAMADKMKKVTITVSSDLTETKNGTVCLKYTEDYILRINLRQFYGMSDQDQYFKDAAVRGTAGMSATDFYAAVVNALNLSFAREVGATKTSNPYFTFSSSANGIVIEEKPQAWTLGVQSAERVLFEVVPTTIYNPAVGDVEWGVVTPATSNLTTVGNGKKIADLEYFLLGERGDQYRKIGWPNDIETKGLVDPSKEYNVLEIHYKFNDTGVNSYATEKDITIVVPKGAEGSETTVIDAIIGAFNTATGLSVAVLTPADDDNG